MRSSEIEQEIFELIPHRPPMLLINKIQSLNENASQSIVVIDSQTPFVQDSGVPSWIGLEYMGQTAAMIAGFQLREGMTKPHLGFLLGSRNYSASQSYFTVGTQLLVSCKEAALVGDSLATFDCTIQDNQSMQEIATASLSVFRKPVEQ